MRRCRHVLLVVVIVAAVGRATRAEPLLYERFENSAVGAVEGGVTFTTDVVDYGGLAVANRHAAVFDGKRGTCIDHGTTKKVRSADFSVEAYVKLASRPDHDVIAADWNEDENNRSWALVLVSNGAVRFDVSPDGDFHIENKLETPPRLIQPGAWHHVAAVSQGDVSRIYVNGREVAQRTRAKSGLFTGDEANLKIGGADRYATTGPRTFHGCLDEVRITEASLAPGDFVKTKEAMPELSGPVPEAFGMPFAATTKTDAAAWQEAARKRLFKLVEEQAPRIPTDDVPLDFQLGDAEDKGVYTLHKASFQGNSNQGVRYPCLFAVPKGEGPFPAMLCIHGHGGSAEKAFDSKSIYHGFADRFARGGYVVLAPSFPHRPYCAMMLWDLFRAVDILQSRPDVDPQRIGVGGLSMGGEWTMWIAATDPRLKVAVVSGWMCTTEGVFSVPNCACWELPGFVELMDVCEVHLLIAPRPVVFESAEHDTCFPIRHTKAGYARIRAGYRVFGAEEAALQDVWPAGHEWHGVVAYPLVDKVLGGRAARVE
ncbi:MAG: acetylxylan esterase [Planctomycetes bacterium]|nr:acetylxylan esterase [Planctomycetota bacterium]